VDRPRLQQLCAQLRIGNLIVLWKLDRLGCNLRDLLTFVSDLEGDGIEVVSLTEQMDTTTMCWLVYERNSISERPKAGLRAARARGRKFGDAQINRVAELLRAGQLMVDEICAIIRIGCTTLYRYITPEGDILTEPRL